jgi:hypothetical protein
LIVIQVQGTLRHLLQCYPVGPGKLPPDNGIKFGLGELFEAANKFAPLKFLEGHS